MERKRSRPRIICERPSGWGAKRMSFSVEYLSFGVSVKMVVLLCAQIGAESAPTPSARVGLVRGRHTPLGKAGRANRAGVNPCAHLIGTQQDYVQSSVDE